MVVRHDVSLCDPQKAGEDSAHCVGCGALFRSTSKDDLLDWAELHILNERRKLRGLPLLVEESI